MEITLSSDNIKELVSKHINSLNIGIISNIKFVNKRSGKIEAVITIDSEADISN